MANRFPLIVNPDSKEIQELKQNDNLDLTGNGLYAGGSLGSNGQVLTSNGTSVEWRTVTGGGGGGGGLDQNTTYIIETEEATDGATLNLVAGGSGIGTIKVKFLDSDQLKFDVTNSLTFAPSIKDNSITNTKLQNSSFTVQVDGVNQTVSLGGSFSIPIYGNVYTTATQTLTNKTLNNCLLSGAINTFSQIPNSALTNSSIFINGQQVSLGGSINIAGGDGGVDTNTTYSISAVDWSEGGINNPNKKALRLTGSDASTDNVVFVAGSRISLSRSGDEITITGTEVNTDTDTDTTYSVNSDTLIVNTNNVGARINLVGGGTGSGNGITDRINLRNGTGVTVSSTNADDITFSIGQNVATSSNVTFNSLTLTGSLTVAGALTYVNTTNLVVTDKTITIADGVTNSTLANGAGILLGTSNINLTYNHDVSSWESTANFNLVPTKSYRIGGTSVLTATQVLGKSMPTGNVVGTIDTQTLNNKTIVNPVISSIINTGTVYFPAPNIADTLVGRNTSDTLTNKIINGNNNTITNIGNSSLSNSSITINGNTVALGGTITVTSQDPYNDERAQDAVAGSFTNGVHTGISFTYDDTTGRINANVTGGSGGGGIAEVVSDTTPQLGGNLDLNNNNITGAGDINISGDVIGEGLKLSANNPTISGTPGTAGEIRRIGGAPFWYDGSEWREFFLINSTAVTQTADTDWDNTILRSTFDTNIDDVRFGVTPDNSGGSITSAAVKVGTSSLRLQNQYLRYPHRAEYDFTGEWTIEGWFYWDTLPFGTGQSSDCIFSKYDSVFASLNFMIGAEVALGGYVDFYWKNNASSTHNGNSGTLVAQYSSSQILQTWNHIAVVREPLDGSIHFYLNGVEHGSTGSNQVIDNDIANSSNHNLALGYYQNNTDSRNFDGYVDDFRISTIARYTANFTPPTTPLPVTGSTTTVILPPTNKSGVLTLGVTPTWRGTSGVTVTQQSSGNYRLTFASAYANADDYYAITSVMDTGAANNVFVVTNRSTTHVDFIVAEGGNLINVADVAIQIINHD